MSKEVDNTIKLEEAKAAIRFCRTYGGRESIQEYLEPLREFLKEFGSLERFDHVLEQATEAFGVELSEEQKAEQKKLLPTAAKKELK